MATGRVPTTANSPLTAKGDLFGYSTTQARVPVGNDGETIVADSSQATGLRYTAGTVQANPIINSAFQIAQRGTSFSTAANASAYTLDRWLVRTFAANMANTVSRQNTNDTTNLPNIQYCARVQRNSGQTGTSYIFFEQGVETLNSVPYAGKTVTLSFYARAGANYSASASAFNTQIVTGTGTDQMPANYTGSVAQQKAYTLTTTWQRFSQTVTLAATTTEFGLGFFYEATGTAGANDWFELTGVQIDIGSVALPFRTYAGTIQGELAACQRYYIRTTGGTSTGNSMGFQSQATTTTIVDFMIAPQVSMRTYPTSVDYSNIGVYRYANATNYSGGTITMYLSSNITNTIIARYTHGSAIFTINDGVAMNTASNAATYIGFSAEL
jgi:hypothetical protein